MKNILQSAHQGVKNHRYTAIVMAAIGLVVATPAGLNAQVLVHEEGTTTYTQAFSANSLITISGGQATFTNAIGNSSVINIAGGTGLFQGTLRNGIQVNVTSGYGELSNSGNNPILNVTGGELLLKGAMGRNAVTTVSGSGVLSLGGNNLFPNNVEMAMVGGTLNTNGYNVALNSLTLTGDSVIDLGGNPNSIIDVGAITGIGTVTFVNYVAGAQVHFDQANTTVDIQSQIFFGTLPAIVGDSGYLVPVPEPGTYFAGGLLLAAALLLEWRRRKGSRNSA